MAQVGQAMINNYDQTYRPPMSISRWLLLTQRIHDTDKAIGPKIAIQKCNVIYFGDGFVESRPEYFHPSQVSSAPNRTLVTETAEEIQKLMGE